CLFDLGSAGGHYVRVRSVRASRHPVALLFFVPATAPAEIYPLSLHDALPIWPTFLLGWPSPPRVSRTAAWCSICRVPKSSSARRSEEHTSELQSRENLVCRLLLEKKKNAPQTWHRLSRRVCGAGPAAVTFYRG